MKRTPTAVSGRLDGTVLVLAAVTLWGTTGATQAAAGLPVSPAALGGARILSGGLILLAVALARPGARPALPPWRVLLLAGAATGVFQPAYLAAVSRCGVALATAIVFGVVPVVTGLLDRDGLNARWAAGTAVAITGCALLLLPGSAGRVDAGGAVAAILAGCCYAVYTVAAKRIGGDVTAVALTLLIGGAPLLPWVLAEGAVLAGPRGLAVIAWLGPVTTAVAYLLFVHGLREVPAAAAATLSLAEPLVAALLGVVVLHERLSALSTLGCVLLLAGLALPAAGARAGSR